MDEPWWASELCSGTGQFLEGVFSQVLVFSQITPQEVICFLSIWLPSLASCPSVQAPVLAIIVTPYWFLGCSSVRCHFFTASWLRSCRRQREWLFWSTTTRLLAFPGGSRLVSGVADAGGSVNWSGWYRYSVRVCQCLEVLCAVLCSVCVCVCVSCRVAFFCSFSLECLVFVGIWPSQGAY